MTDNDENRDRRSRMKEQLEHRLAALKAEFEAGQRMLADLETRQAELRNALIRISGAVQVLEEELAKAAAAGSSAVASGDKEANGFSRLDGGAF
jgi:chromosome segregation ATPase